MDAGNDMGTFIRNPVNWNGSIVVAKQHSSVLVAMGLDGNFNLPTFNRLATVDRSPWLLKNLSKRHDCRRELQELLEQEDNAIRHFTFHTIHPTVMCGTQQDKSITLGEILRARYDNQLGPLEASLATKIAMEVLTTLKYLHHDMGVVHGDMNVFNIQLKIRSREVTVCGFGNHTVKPSNGVTSENIPIGLWSAPEVLRDAANISSKADIFSYGLVVYSMLACIPPHTFPGILDTTVPDTAELRECYAQFQREKVGVCTMERKSRARVVFRRKKRSYASMSTAPYPQQPDFVYYVPKKENGTRKWKWADENTPPGNSAQPTTSARSEQASVTTGTDTMLVPKANHLNYACLGTRPVIPNVKQLGREYDTLLAIFYTCTETEPTNRPSARRLLRALSEDDLTSESSD